MSYYVKDDTLTQRQVEYTADLQINHSGNTGVGLEALDARMYEGLRNYNKSGLGRMYTPVFTIGDNHTRTLNGLPYISYYLKWPHNIGTGDRILSLEACETEEGPWTEVARVDSTNEPLSWTETRVSLKMDVKNRSFGSGSGDTGGASKHGVANKSNITGYVQIGTYYPRSWQSPAFSVSGMDNLSFNYIIGNDRNGLEYVDYNRERFVMQIIRKRDNHVLSTKYLDNSNRTGSWALYNWNVKNLSGNVYLRIHQPKHSGGKYDGMGLCFMKGTSTVTHYKSGDGVANFFFNRTGEFIGADVTGDGRPYLSGNEPGRGLNKRFFRFSCISKGGHTLVTDVKPNFSKGYVLSPFGQASEKWWEPKEIFAKDAGNWKEVREVYVKNNGNWEKVFPIFLNTENYVSINNLDIKGQKDYIPISSVYIDNAVTTTTTLIAPPPVLFIGGVSSATANPTWAISPTPESGYVTGTNWAWGYNLYSRGEKISTHGIDTNDAGSKNLSGLVALEVDGPAMDDLDQVGSATAGTGSVQLQNDIKVGDLLVAVGRYYSHGNNYSIATFKNNRPAGWTVQSFIGGDGWYSGIYIMTKIATSTDAGKTISFGTAPISDVYVMTLRDKNNKPVTKVTKLGEVQRNSDNNPSAVALNWTGMNIGRYGQKSYDAPFKYTPPLSNGALVYGFRGWGDSNLFGGAYGNYFNYGPVKASDISLTRSTNHYSMTAHGYFIPYESGTYQFRLWSDDGSAFYLGDHAKYRSKRTKANVQINHGGLHAPSWSSIYSVKLTAGQRYPFWTAFYEKHGADILQVYVKSPSDSGLKISSTNWDWKHDPSEDFTIGSKYYNG